MPAMDGARGLVLADRYRIGEVVGVGGMSTVYRARDELLGRDVAVKLFPPTPSVDDLRRQEAEIAVLAQLNHPNLVILLDAGSGFAGGPAPQTYIVMEFVAGPTLAALLQVGPLPRATTAVIGRQLAEALMAVHDGQVIHRDVKPANVLLVDMAETPGGELSPPRVKLADFGIARVIDAARLTLTGLTMGTATYLSPEQAAGAEVGPPSDVYSLGLVLLECLTGHRAFSGSIVEVAAARLATGPSIPADLGSGWARLLTAMTRREPAERISTAEAAALLGALELGAPAPDAPGEIPPVERTMVLPPVGNDVHLVGDPAVTSAMPSPFEPPTFEPPTSELPTSEPPARRRPRTAVLAVVGTLLVAVVVGLVLMLGRPGVGSTAPGAVLDPPAVQGPLGAALTDLVESVQP